MIFVKFKVKSLVGFNKHVSYFLMASNIGMMLIPLTTSYVSLPSVSHAVLSVSEFILQSL